MLKAAEKNILTQKVKRKCYITDESELVELRIRDIIEDAIVKVSDLIGITDNKFDYSKSGLECELFKNYCFYLWNDKTIKDFEESYISDILKLRHKYMILDKNEDNDNE